MSSFYCFILLFIGISTCLATDQYEALLLKMNQLEAKVRDQEIRLQSVELSSFQVKTAANQISTGVFVPRTCQEARDSGLTEFKNSGMYWIDPDGLGIGNGPIYVHCNMTNGMTSVSHDSELITPIPKCSTPGCYSKSIEYQNSTLKQLKALADLSAGCRQSIQVNCIGGPLTLNGIDYAWWNDVDGNVRNFWSGSSSDLHTCQCGIDGLCIDKNSQNPQLKCNCDANIAVNLSDIGAVTLKQILPITQLNFGKTSFTGGSHLLGKLECSGRLDRPATIPTSCYDLWIQGHTLNGLYNVKKDNKISSIFCDFTAGRDVSESLIGEVDVKSNPVSFYVQRQEEFSDLVNPLSFDRTQTNVGAAMNAGSGIFTAPTSGIYLFDFSGVSVPTGNTFNIDFYLNNIKKGSSLADAEFQFTMTLPSIWHLRVDDRVYLKLSGIKGTLSNNPDSPLVHFTGVLLEEDLSF